MTTKSDKTLDQLLAQDVEPRSNHMRSPGERNLLQFSPFTRLEENRLSPQGRFCRVRTKISGSNAPQNFRAIGSHELSQGCSLDSQDGESRSQAEFSEDLNDYVTEAGIAQANAEVEPPAAMMTFSKKKKMWRKTGDAAMQRVSPTTTRGTEMSPRRKKLLGLSLAGSKGGREMQTEAVKQLFSNQGSSSSRMNTFSPRSNRVNSTSIEEGGEGKMRGLGENMSRKTQMLASRSSRQSIVSSEDGKEEKWKMGTEGAVRKLRKSGSGRSSRSSRLSNLSMDEEAGKKDSADCRSEVKDEVKTGGRRSDDAGEVEKAKVNEGGVMCHSSNPTCGDLMSHGCGARDDVDEGGWIADRRRGGGSARGSGDREGLRDWEGPLSLQTFLWRLGGKGGRMGEEESGVMEKNPGLRVSRSLNDVVVGSRVGNSGAVNDEPRDGGIMERKGTLLEGVFARFGGRKKASLRGDQMGRVK